jgi:hypothetical protein
MSRSAQVMTGEASANVAASPALRAQAGKSTVLNIDRANYGEGCCRGSCWSISLDAPLGI